MKLLKLPLYLTWLGSVVWSNSVFPWGERGHDLVTRVAVKQLDEISQHNPALTRPFKLRDHMLSHLSNAPDFYWRSPAMSDAERALNYPTHFIGMETAYPDQKDLNEFDTSIDYFYQSSSGREIRDPSQIGTAPWRVLQFYKLLTESLATARSAKSRDSLIEATNQVLLYAGLMSHFVGDLANPHHTTENFNGQLTGNTGLHAYFEDDLVRELPLALDADIEALAGAELLGKTILSAYPPEEHAAILADPEKLIFALVFESNSKVDLLHALDDDFAILKRSTDTRAPAFRRPPREVMHRFRPFITERIAVGASVLAQLWKLSWQAATKPNLSSFQSYHYFVTPEFIEPDYLR